MSQKREMCAQFLEADVPDIALETCHAAVLEIGGSVQVGRCILDQTCPPRCQFALGPPTPLPSGASKKDGTMMSIARRGLRTAPANSSVMHLHGASLLENDA